MWRVNNSSVTYPSGTRFGHVAHLLNHDVSKMTMYVSRDGFAFMNDGTTQAGNIFSNNTEYRIIASIIYPQISAL